jgi:hypothetical protein
LAAGPAGLTGTFDWKPCEVVFDVPRTAMGIEAGVGRTGVGTVWLDDVRLEEVEPNTKVTGLVREKVDPENLDFEQ